MKLPSNSEFNLNRKSSFKNEINESSSKSLLANVFDEKTNEYVLNDSFGVVANNPNPSRTHVSYSNQIVHKNLPSYYANSCGPNDFLNERISYKHKQKSYINNDILTVKKEIHLILEEIRRVTKKIKDDDDDANKELDWKFAAMVLDRLCLFVFGILTIVSTSAILFSAPNFFKLK
jgi:hypothetical protein